MNKLASQVKDRLISLEIYQPEFDTTIEIYASLVEQYQALEKDFKRSKFTVVEKTGYADNAKRHPIVGSMESLRKDILTYSTALGLTPAGLRKIKANMKPDNKKVSKLEQALNKFGS